jgi:hypothetical protein
MFPETVYIYKDMKVVLLFFMLAGTNWQTQPTGFPATCTVKGVAKIHATAQIGLSYDKDFDVGYALQFHIDYATRAASIDVTHKGHTSSVKGMLQNDSLITITVGQTIPESFDGQGFSAALTGTVKSGWFSHYHGVVRMHLNLDAAGTITAAGLPIAVQGTIGTNAHE